MNLPDIGKIKGLARIELSDSDKLTVVEFIIELKKSGIIKGADTEKRLMEFILYLNKKLGTRKLTVDAQTAHILWLFMDSFISKIDKRDIDEYTRIMLSLADGLDKK